jgi:hypothetical protein
MVKIIKFIVCICVFINGLFIENTSDFCFAENDKDVVYARVLSDCVLFKNKEMIYEFDNVYFQIPESYFIVVLETISENCLKVQYGKYIGFVDSDDYVKLDMFEQLYNKIRETNSDIVVCDYEEYHMDEEKFKYIKVTENIKSNNVYDDV